MAESILRQVRDRARWVAEHGRLVTISPDHLQQTAAKIAGLNPVAIVVDPGREPLANEISTVAFVLTLDAINFGSGWFPKLQKLPGLSGYQTVATLLRRHFETVGMLSARNLSDFTPSDLASLLEQRPDGPVADLLMRYTQSLNELGRFLIDRFSGRFEALVEAADHSAESLVGLFKEMSLYRDVAIYRDVEVPFYKRAQITAADLALSLGGRGLGHFDDLDQLTAFADNVVPHVLRCHNILRYEVSLATSIDAGNPIASGSDAEIEIRASAIHAVELLVQSLRDYGQTRTAIQLDSILWQLGHLLPATTFLSHRTLTTNY